MVVQDEQQRLTMGFGKIRLSVSSDSFVGTVRAKSSLKWVKEKLWEVRKWKSQGKTNFACNLL